MTAGSLFNDPSTSAWFVVAAYFIGAAAAFMAGRSARRRDARFWIGAALLLVILGLNKELDLQSMLTESARALTRNLGWYEQRRLLQGLFLLALAGAGLAVIATLVNRLRYSALPVKVAAIGIGLLFAFILLRAASFHHIDEWVTIDVAGVRSGWWLELAGIAVIALSALAYRSGPRHR